MRPIRFRAWDVYFKEMVDDLSSEIYASGLDNEGKLWLESRADGGEFILLQYTGLKDKNGKEIYEGDVLKVHRAYPLDSEHPETNWYSDVRFLEGGFYLKDTDGERNMTINRYHDEVIGNICENPELLKEGDN